METAADEYDIKIIIEQIKIQPKNSIANIVKELKTKNTEFHTYKPKQEKSFRLIHKYTLQDDNLDDIKKEIEELG
jgi:hypothetical protein